MITKYSLFINELFSIENDHSLGEYISNLADKDEYIKMIVGEYTKDIDPSISFSNAINVLDDLVKIEILKRVENHLNGFEGETNVIASTDINLLEESYGKNVLGTFFKCLTALGFKDNTYQKEEIPAEFLIIFKMSGVDSSRIDSVFKRFKSLSSISIDYTHPTMGLYFGIKVNGDFEYGYYYHDLVPIGNFKLTKSSFNSLKLSEFKSSVGLKSMLVNLNLNDILLLCKIKTEMIKFNPGYHETKTNPIVEDRIIRFSYFGYGKWNQGVLDESDLIQLKNNIKSYLSKYKWSNDIQVNVYPNKFWVNINIKLK